MKVDIVTAMAAVITLLVIIGCQFLFFWIQDRRSRWLAWLIVPFAMGAAGVLLIVWRWFVADYLGFGVGYALVLGAFGLLWQGVRVFERQQPALVPLLAACGGWLALSLWPPFLADMPVRIAVHSAGVAIFCALIARTLWQGRGEQLPSRLPAIFVISSYACIMGLRIALIGLVPYPIGGQPIQPAWVGVFNLIVFGHIATFAVLMVTMTKERREIAQHNDALTDPLTGLLNRRAFAQQAQRIVFRRKFGREQTSLMVLDLDHFKAVNDCFGHDAGDRVLQRFAQIAGSSMRPTDMIYRMGGEEFCFVLPDTPVAGAIAAAERVRRTLELSRVEIDGDVVRVTASIGIVTTDFAGFDLEVLRAAADAALYEAKARGRNRVVVADPTAIPRPKDRSGDLLDRRAG